MARAGPGLLALLLAALVGAAAAQGGAAAPSPAPANAAAANSTELGSTDKEVLLRLKRTFSNGNTVLASWNDSQPVCLPGGLAASTTWLGVACGEDGRVQFL